MPTTQNVPLNPVLEVSQTLSGTTVSVELLAAERNESRRSKRALVVAGVFFVVLSAAVFARSVSVSAENDRAHHQWVEVDRKPLFAFRPKRPSLFNDALAFGGLFASLLCFGGALAIRRRISNSLVIGDDAEGRLSWPGQSSFELARVDHGNATIALPAGAAATVSSSDGSAREASGQFALAMDESLRIPCGLGAILVRWTEKPRRAALTPVFAPESRTFKFIAASAVAHLAVLALLMTIPPESKAMHTDQEGMLVSLSGMRLDADEDPRREKEKSNDSGEEGAVTPAGMATASSEGDRGTPESTVPKTKAAIKRRDDEPRLARPMTVDDVRHVGVLSVLPRANFTALTSTHDFESGMESETMLGNSFDGLEPGEGTGPGGSFGQANGSGISPYGGDWGSIHAGWPPGSRIGEGPTGRDYERKLSGNGKGIRGRVSRDPIIKIKTPNCGVAGCDKNLIGRYVRRQRRRIRNCYERAMITSPNLSGTITARFLIHPNGKVSSAKASGMGDAELGKCVAGVVKSIKFPVVADGVVAAVTYPFFLSQSGT